MGLESISGNGFAETNRDSEFWTEVSGCPTLPGSGIWGKSGWKSNGATTKVDRVAREHFKELHRRLVEAVRAADPAATFRKDSWVRAAGGGGTTCVLSGGNVFEKAAVNFSAVTGSELPEAASKQRPQLAGRPFEAAGVSVIFHPLNPYVPTAHMNIRWFRSGGDGDPVWWFGGGFDLTPFYPDLESAVEWHQRARAVCEPFGDELYSELKCNCDRYFYLPHRGETRGVGGVFFDDFDRFGLEGSLAFSLSVGNAFWPAWLSILKRRRGIGFGERERKWQAIRRGRYVEFNLVHDRGTLFGLQSGGRVESVLASLPPKVEWHYDFIPEAGSPEAGLSWFLEPRDYLGNIGL